MGSSDLRAAAQQALEALEDMLGWQSLAPQTIQEAAKGRAAALKAALAEPCRYADQCNEEGWCVNGCEARAALADHYCDTHCTWADHADGCVRSEP